jgi:hypothetical protein
MANGAWVTVSSFLHLPAAAITAGALGASYIGIAQAAKSKQEDLRK